MTMNLFKRKNNYKLIFFTLLQLATMAFFFVLLADRQTIFIIKDFIRSLNLGSDVHTFLSQAYMAIKMMIDLPSCFGICVFLIQLVCATITIKSFLFSVCPKKVMIEESKIENPHKKVESVKFAKNFAYLENLRLLN